MRILLINCVCGIRSTGRICTDLAKKFELDGHEVKIAYGRVDEVPTQFLKYAVKIGTDLDLKFHALRTRILDEHGFGSKGATKKFLNWAEEYNPDLVWLHNIHGYYINIEMLFAWIKSRPNMQVRWTLHDCWAFTGHCAYFSMVKCEKWKKHCFECVQKKKYPASDFIDNCNANFIRKKSAFTGVKNMLLITPSHWLADLVRDSFLQNYPIEVHYNTIDTKVFKPTPSNFRDRLGFQNRKVILGVASSWDERKGLEDFIDLSKQLNNKYVIVLVGLSEKQIGKLPQNIIGLGRTNSSKELAELYTMADVFVNPSKEESFGMTTIEAMSCGTKVIVYKGTACEEIAEKYEGVYAVDEGVENIFGKIIELLN